MYSFTKDQGFFIGHMPPQFLTGAAVDFFSASRHHCTPKNGDRKIST
jgi:hypothetical protein